MLSPKLLTLSLMGGVAALAWGWVFPSQANLSASGGPLTLLADSDGDGLDDALEARLMTKGDLSDSDADGFSDLEEILVGTDPMDGQSQTGGAIVPASYLNLYALGNKVVVSIYALRQTGVSQLEMFWAGPNGMTYFRPSDIAGNQVDVQTRPTSWPGFEIEFVRYEFKRSAFEQPSSVTFGVQALLDNQILSVSSATLTKVGGVLSQLVWDGQINSTVGNTPNAAANGNQQFEAEEFGGQGGSTSSSGGIVPVEPDNGGHSNDGSADEVCVQILSPTGHLGNGRMEYTVDSASCEPMVGAICLTGCSATIGETIIGVDIVGLLGG